MLENLRNKTQIYFSRQICCGATSLKAISKIILNHLKKNNLIKKSADLGTVQKWNTAESN